MSSRVFGVGEEAMAIISENIDGEKGNWGSLTRRHAQCFGTERVVESDDKNNAH